MLNTVIGVSTVIANLTPPALKLFELVRKRTGKGKAAETEGLRLFYAAYREMRDNLATLEELRSGVWKNLAVNGPECRALAARLHVRSMERLLEEAALGGKPFKGAAEGLAALEKAARLAARFVSLTGESGPLLEVRRPVRIGAKVANMKRAHLAAWRALFKDGSAAQAAAGRRPAAQKAKSAAPR
jgi:hypothetical protein